MAKNIEESLFETVKEVDDSSLATIPEDKKKPRPGDPEWTDYVLSHLTEKEWGVAPKGKKVPVVAGLVRLIPKLMGEILVSDPTVTYRGDGFSSVKHIYQVRISDEVRIFSGVADATPRNLDPPFSKFLDANASTRAKGRAAKDVLHVNIVTLEELSRIAEEDDDNENGMTPGQAAAITHMSGKLKINVNKFIKNFKSKYDSINDVDRDDAVKLIELLNSYQAGKEIPQGVKA